MTQKLLLRRYKAGYAPSARKITPPRKLIVLKREKRLASGEVAVARLR